MLRIAAVLLLVSSGAHAMEWNESWRYCQFSHECKIMKDECQNWAAVNAEVADQAQAYFDYARAFVDCGERFFLPPPKPACNVKTRSCEVSYE